MESTDEVAAYVAKYVGKDVRDQAARKVITFSKGWRQSKRFKIPGPLKAERVPWFGKDTGAMAMLGINALICEWKRKGCECFGGMKKSDGERVGVRQVSGGTFEGRGEFEEYSFT